MTFDRTLLDACRTITSSHVRIAESIRIKHLFQTCDLRPSSRVGNGKRAISAQLFPFPNAAGILETYNSGNRPIDLTGLIAAANRR